MAAEVIAVPADGEDSERKPEEKHEEQCDPEWGHRQPDHAAEVDRVIHGSVVLGGGDHRQRHGKEHGQKSAVDKQKNGFLDALADDGRHRLALNDRRSEIALDCAPEKISVLDQHRLVEAELGMSSAKHLFGRPPAEHELDRIPRHQLHGEECDQRDPDEHRDHGKEPPEHVAENAHRARARRLFRSLSDALGNLDLLKRSTNDAGRGYLSSQTSLSHQGPVTEFAKPFT